MAENTKIMIFYCKCGKAITVPSQEEVSRVTKEYNFPECEIVLKPKCPDCGRQLYSRYKIGNAIDGQ